MQRWGCAFGAGNRPKTAQHIVLNALTDSTKKDERNEKMRMRNNPCIGCNDRSAECHASCTAYAEAKKQHDELVKSICKQKQTEQDVIDIFATKKRKRRR